MKKLVIILLLLLLATPVQAQQPPVPRAALQTVVEWLQQLLAVREPMVVTTAEQLQQALSEATEGDIIEVPAETTLVGHFKLGPKAGVVTLRGGGALRSPDNQPVLSTLPKASNWVIENLTFTTALPGVVVRFGTSSQTLDEVPHNLVLRNSRLLGDPIMGGKRGLELHSGNTQVIGNHFADIKLAGQDTQCIGGWNGPGPYLIEKNWLECAGENVMFGGADPSIPNLVPSNITIIDNDFTKNPDWRGKTWTVKNLLELKAASRVIINGNRFWNFWAAGQAYAILFKTVNQDGRCTWCVVEHVTFENNRIWDVSNAFNLHRDPGARGFFGQPAHHITIRNNHVQTNRATFGGNGWFLLQQGVPYTVVQNNTVLNDGSSTIFFDGPPSPGMEIVGNILLDNGLGIKGTGTGEGAATLAVFAPDAVFKQNLIKSPDARLYAPLFNTVVLVLPADTAGFGAGR